MSKDEEWISEMVDLLWDATGDDPVKKKAAEEALWQLLAPLDRFSPPPGPQQGEGEATKCK
jgi:hypothetical protein